MGDPKNDVQSKLQSIRSSIPDGSKWQHYKGGRYEVVTVCVKEDSLEPMVVYRSLKYGSTWARTIENWNDSVDVDGVSTPRFIQLVE